MGAPPWRVCCGRRAKGGGRRLCCGGFFVREADSAGDSAACLAMLSREGLLRRFTVGFARLAARQPAVSRDPPLPLSPGASLPRRSHDAHKTQDPKTTPLASRWPPASPPPTRHRHFPRHLLLHHRTYPPPHRLQVIAAASSHHHRICAAPLLGFSLIRRDRFE
jgi:hypothetical protein